MKKIFKLALLLLVLLVGFNMLINSTTADSKYNLNADLVKQVSANVPDYTSLNQVPKDFPHAVIAIEDHRFYKHHGFDVEGIARAYLTNLKDGTITQGGSTITQQLAKNLFLSNDRTYTRKIKELFLAMKLEKLYTKDEILEMYINVVYYGSDAYGIQAASRTYFNKNASALTREECAMLAGLLQAPSIYNPKVNPALAAERQKTVLSLMNETEK
jgi:penicillin-binding protein 1A/penicillin-binding protein 2A